MKLGEPGYKERYYADKFGCSDPVKIDETRRDVVLKYVEGLCWVCRYYYQGVCSWQWFYPYHYAPFASDIKDLADAEITFFPGQPFKPFDQLMGTLPASSSSALPEKYRGLMTDPSSPIFEFYPSDFEVDMNGKRFAWQGVVKLPFIDEKKLVAETKKLEDTLTEEEKVRNSMMHDLLYVYRGHPFAAQIVWYYQYYQYYYQLFPCERLLWPVDTRLSGGMNGYLWLCERNGWKYVVPSPINGLEVIQGNHVLNVTYLNPPHHTHIPELPKGVIPPQKVLKYIDVKPFPGLWHEENSRHQQGRQRPQVSTAVSGPVMGDTALRMLKHSLHIKPNNYSSRYSNQLPYRNSRSNHAINTPRLAGPSGYESRFSEDSNQYNGNYSNPRGAMGNPGFPFPYDTQGSKKSSRGQGRCIYQEQTFSGQDKYSCQEGYSSRQDNYPYQEQFFRTHDRFLYQDNNYRKQDRFSNGDDLISGISALSMEAVKTRPGDNRLPYQDQQNNSRHGMHLLPPFGQPRTNDQSLYIQDAGPLPAPPGSWISKGGYSCLNVRQQEPGFDGTHEKPVKKVYLAKTQELQDLSDPSLQQ